MIISWPHMGSISVLMSSIFDDVGVEYVLPPPSSQRTLELGSRHCPEFACVPLKTTLGNYIEAMEQGADTLIMIAGKGPCRFGFYAETHRRILEEAGYEANMIPLEFHLDKLGELVSNIKMLKQGKSWKSLVMAIRFAMHKAYLLDQIEQQSLHQRCYDKERGATSKALRKATKMIGDCGTFADLERLKTEAMEEMKSVPRKEINPVSIGIVGEFYLVLDPYFNLQVEEQLGDLGAYVERSIYLTDWLRPSGKNPVLGHTSKESEETARPYLTHSVGGEGVHSIGHTVLYKRAGFDGVVHLLPFTCMPETIAKGILPMVSRDQGIPVISLVIDEQTGKAGVATRLEAFTDLAGFRRRHHSHLKAASHDPRLLTV